MEEPVIECTCPSGTMRGRCRHADDVWNGLTPFQRRLAVEGAEVVKKLNQNYKITKDEK
jgi:hypothetical protein